MPFTVKFARNIALKVASLLLLLLRPRTCNAAQSYKTCYSCMSNFYDFMWERAEYNRMFMRPESFTDDCADPAKAKWSSVGVVRCDTACVVLAEEFKIGVGMRSFVRGCYNGIFMWGFNKTGYAGRLEHREFCHHFNLSQLMAGIVRNFDTKVLACSCYGDLCNSGTSVVNRTNRQRQWTVLIALLLAVITVPKPWTHNMYFC